MIKNIILVILAIGFLYYMINYYNLKNNIENLKFSINKKIEYNGINRLFENPDKNLLELQKKYDEIILKNNKLSNERDIIRDEYQNLMADISHDLRTPLTSILGFLELTKEEKDIKKIREYIDIVEKKAGYLNTLIEKFYEFSIIISDNKKVEKEYFDLKEFLYSIGFSYYDNFSNKKQSFEINIIEEEIEIFSNKKLLSTVFNNLFGNMEKYSLGENKVEVNKENDRIVVVFSNKVNISDGNYDYLFKRSEVLEKARKNSSGIGLSIVEASLEKLEYGSKIYVENGRFKVKVVIL